MQSTGCKTTAEKNEMHTSLYIGMHIIGQCCIIFCLQEIIFRFQTKQCMHIDAHNERNNKESRNLANTYWLQCC